MGRRKRDRQFDMTARQNKVSYVMYYDRLKEIAMSMFKWKNLPPEIDERFLELTLFDRGKALFFKDEDFFCALPFTDNGRLDLYRRPITRRAYADNGFNRVLSNKESVIIYNNYLRKNCVTEIKKFAYRLYDLDQSIDINARAQKTPIVLLCDESQRLTVENLYMDYDGNKPVIHGCKNLFADNKIPLTVLKTDAPYVADRLYELKTQIWNEALTYLGVSNINTSKKERMITDEVTRNQGGVVASRYSRLEARKQACREINAMFGTNIDVEFREDYVMLDEARSKEYGLNEGGESDE